MKRKSNIGLILGASFSIAVAFCAITALINHPHEKKQILFIGDSLVASGNLAYKLQDLMTNYQIEPRSFKGCPMSQISNKLELYKDAKKYYRIIIMAGANDIYKWDKPGNNAPTWNVFRNVANKFGKRKVIFLTIPRAVKYNENFTQVDYDGQMDFFIKNNIRFININNVGVWDKAEGLTDDKLHLNSTGASVIALYIRYALTRKGYISE